MSAAACAACGAFASAAAWAMLGMAARDVLALGGDLRRVGRTISSSARAMAGKVPRVGGRPGVGLSEVSEMVDIVRLGMSAGLSFDAAVDLYCCNRRGALARELTHALLSWQVGVEVRSEALERAGGHLGVPALKTFSAIVCQALEFGAPVSQSLAGLSREVREMHRADVERRIERAPVKILVPTGTLVLPALLIAIMGPLLAAGGMV